MEIEPGLNSFTTKSFTASVLIDTKLPMLGMFTEPVWVKYLYNKEGSCCCCMDIFVPID
jgi:hypothetical protein